MSKVTDYKFEAKTGPSAWVQQIGPQAQLRLVEDKPGRRVQMFLEFISVKGRTTRSIELSEDQNRALRDYDDRKLQGWCRQLAEDPRAETLLRILSSIAADLAGYGISAGDWDDVSVAPRFEGLMDAVEPGRAYGKAKAQLPDALDVAEALDWLCDTPVGIVLVEACTRRDAAGAPVQAWLENDLQQLVFRDAHERLLSPGQMVKEILREHYRLKTPGTKL
ncbi:hypothetical protein IT575_12260 [bacterium]|nr:hypothetical protein [bacterium]